MFSFPCWFCADTCVLCKAFNILIRINPSIYQTIRASVLDVPSRLAFLINWNEITYLSHFPGWLNSQTHLQPEFHRKLSSPNRAKENMKLGKC